MKLSFFYKWWIVHEVDSKLINLELNMIYLFIASLAWPSAAQAGEDNKRPGFAAFFFQINYHYF